MSAGVVILGAGQAGFQLAASLREGGYEAPVTLVGEEAEPPYQRPPLSKVFLKGEDGPESLSFRPPAFFERHDIALRLGTRAAEIDREAARVRTEPGGWIGYDQLVLATGARNRPLALPGATLENVVSLRGAEDGLALRAALARARRVVIIGGGFLGLEVAASARAMGADVHVIEAGERLMGRAVSPAVSRHFLEHHRASGVVVELGRTISAIAGRTCAEGVTTTEGQNIPADLGPAHPRDRGLRAFPERPRRRVDAAGIRAERGGPGSLRRGRDPRPAAALRGRALVLVGPGGAAADRGADRKRRRDGDAGRPRRLLRLLLPRGCADRC